MSGSSLDGIDAVLLDLPASAKPAHQPRCLATHHHVLPGTLRTQLVTTQCRPPSASACAILDRQLGHLFADAVLALLAQANVAPTSITAIGSHGHTICHAPDGQLGYTLQIGDPFTIAERTGLPTIADFRRRDVALGGQGAPLAPLFHQAIFASPDTPRGIINLGGIANLTALSADNANPPKAFDTGPGNALLDLWCEQHTGQHYDKDGRWAAEGQCQATLLANMLKDPYFNKPPPKSTGRDYFNSRWLQAYLVSQPTPKPVDVQATLLALTVQSLVRSIQQTQLTAAELYLCGGGAYNQALVSALRAALPRAQLANTAALGIAPEWVEAAAFAWLAQQHCQGIALPLPPITGAHKPAILGTRY